MSEDGRMGAPMAVSGCAGRLEVIDGWTGRRRRSEPGKARIAVARPVPDMRVAGCRPAARDDAMAGP